MKKVKVRILNKNYEILDDFGYIPKSLIRERVIDRYKYPLEDIVNGKLILQINYGSGFEGLSPEQKWIDEVVIKRLEEIVQKIENKYPIKQDFY